MAAAAAASGGIPTTTKAISVATTGGLEALTYTDVPLPPLGPDAVLVRNEFIGVNFIDTYHRQAGWLATRHVHVECDVRTWT